MNNQINSSIKNKVPKTVKGTLYEKFAPIKVIYEESEKNPEKLITDSSIIKKEKICGVEVWVAENNMVFDCDTTGEPGEFLGRLVDGEFRER